MSKTVIEMVVQCGFWREHIDTWLCSTKDFERFVELVRADERAKLAEQPAQPASEADMQVYKAIADNYHASLQPAPVQEPGLIGRDQCDRLVSLVMSKLARKHNPAMLPEDLNPNIVTHHALRHSIVQAAYMAGASSTTPQAQPAREWVGLTVDKVTNILEKCCDENESADLSLSFARAIEAKLKEKNT